MWETCADVACGNLFALLNEGPLTLTIFLHTVIIIPMFFIYFQEKKHLEDAPQGDW
jgi:ABC-type transport system involved in cytochrome bd biosynthesis fused ATPase/permease subunit